MPAEHVCADDCDDREAALRVEGEGPAFADKLGEVTTDILVEHFTKLLDVQFTARMEELLDEIEEGKVEWHHMLGDFYKDFEPR